MNKLVYIALMTLAVSATLLSGGCYYDNAEDLYPKDTVYVVDTNMNDTTAAISWANDVSSVISTNCAVSGCHEANSGVRQPLTTYNEVKSAIENWNLKQKVESGQMPPASSLASADKSAIIEWINDGYPNN